MSLKTVQTETHALSIDQSVALRLFQRSLFHLMSYGYASFSVDMQKYSTNEINKFWNLKLAFNTLPMQGQPAYSMAKCNKDEKTIKLAGFWIHEGINKNLELTINYELVSSIEKISSDKYEIILSEDDELDKQLYDLSLIKSRKIYITDGFYFNCLSVLKNIKKVSKISNDEYHIFYTDFHVPYVEILDTDSLKIAHLSLI